MFRGTARSLAYQDTDFCLSIFAEKSVLRMVHASLAETNRWEERRRRLPAIVVVWLTLMLALHRSVSIPNVYLKLQMAADAQDPESPPSARVPNDALCHARSRLGFKPLVNLFGKTAEKVRPKGSFAGLPTWLIDGTSCDMPDTEANQKCFGRPNSPRGTAAFPQLKIVLLTCATTRRVKAVRVLPYKESEVAALVPLLSHISTGDVLFVDRGLASYQLLHECQQRGIHLVMRISSKNKPKLKKQYGVGDSLVEGQYVVPASELTGWRKTRDIVVLARMIKFWFSDDDKPTRLMTTLPPELVSARDLAEGYHIRWEVELGIKELKTHLATVSHGSLHTTFRSKSPDLVLQEVFALLAAYNLIRSTMTEAAETHELDPLAISFVGTLEVLRAAIPYLLLKPLNEWPRLREKLLADIAACKLRSYRRPRSYPRKVKKKMSNFKVKRPGDIGQFCDFKAQITLR